MSHNDSIPNWVLRLCKFIGEKKETRASKKRPGIASNQFSGWNGSAHSSPHPCSGIDSTDVINAAYGNPQYIGPWAPFKGYKGD